MSKKAATEEKIPATTVDETAQVPAAIDFAADAGEGLEYADSKCFRIPFIQILQGLSPAIETVDGARPGKFWNNVTNELFDTIVVVPAMFQRVYNRWAPRKDGGGFKGVYDAGKVDKNDIPGVVKAGNAVYIDVPEGKDPLDAEGKVQVDELLDTRNHYILFQSKDGQWYPAMMSFKSSGIKKSRTWISIMDMIKVPGPNGTRVTPATYSHLYELTPIKEENAEGAWWNADVKMVGPVTNPVLYSTAKAFAKQIKDGLVEATPPSE